MSKVKVQESSGRLSITLPKSVADLKGWKKGTTLELKEHAGLVCLVEVRGSLQHRVGNVNFPAIR